MGRIGPAPDEATEEEGQEVRFTAFCQESNGSGTIWIEAIEARSVRHAIEVARKSCAESWGWKDANERIHVLGIARGAVEILHWEDLNDN